MLLHSHHEKVADKCLKSVDSYPDYIVDSVHGPKKIREFSIVGPIAIYDNRFVYFMKGRAQMLCVHGKIKIRG